MASDPSGEDLILIPNKISPSPTSNQKVLTTYFFHLRNVCHVHT